MSLNKKNRDNSLNDTEPLEINASSTDDPCVSHASKNSINNHLVLTNSEESLDYSEIEMSNTSSSNEIYSL